MKKTKKRNPVREILAEVYVGLDGLAENPKAVIRTAKFRQVAILDGGRPVAYVISPAVWEYLTDLVEDEQLAKLARRRLAEDEETITVTLEEL